MPGSNRDLSVPGRCVPFGRVKLVPPLPGPDPWMLAQLVGSYGILQHDRAVPVIACEGYPERGGGAVRWKVVVDAQIHAPIFNQDRCAVEACPRPIYSVNLLPLSLGAQVAAVARSFPIARQRQLLTQNVHLYLLQPAFERNSWTHAPSD